MVAVDLPSEGAAEGEVERQNVGPSHLPNGDLGSGAASPVPVGQDDHAGKADDTTAAPEVDVPDEKELSGSANSSHVLHFFGTHLGNSVALCPSRSMQSSSHFGCFAVHRKSAAIFISPGSGRAGVP